MFFKEVIGQEELASKLIHEVNEDKIGHAQLFLGKPGYGTLPMAIAFSRYLFCENKQKSDGCGACPSCLKINSLQHPDLHFSFPTIQADTKTSQTQIKEFREAVLESPFMNINDWILRVAKKDKKPIISVEEGLEIIKKLNLKSHQGGYKVLIIWYAEFMNPSTSNKLLKLIEEPQPNTLILLLVEEEEKILLTINSRTQNVKFPRINTEGISKFLEKKGANRSQIDSFVSRSEGDLNEAFKLLNNNSASSEFRDHFIQLMRVCYKKDVLNMMEWAELSNSFGKEKGKEFIKYSLYMFRQSILKNYSGDLLMRTSLEEEKFLEKFSVFISGNNLQDLMKDFNDAHYYIDRNANMKILYMNLCFNVMRLINAA